jgi:SRSO17 transposase
MCEGVGMLFISNPDRQCRLSAYFDRIGRVLGHKSRRESFAHYAIGLFSDLERKSVEPIAALVCGDPAFCRAHTEKLLHFVGDSEWDDRAMRLSGVRYALESMTRREVVDSWVFDDTGFIKQGDMSPGVQRQYTGSAGKTTNCQIGVSLTVTTRTLELPIDMDLYLPKSWADDRKRCRAAHIPSELGYRPKWQIALDLATQAIDAGIPGGLVLADSGYGDTGPFRAGIKALGLKYSVDVKKHTQVRIACSDGTITDTMSVATVADVLGWREYRKVTWRQGTRRALSSRFAAVRVHVVHDGEFDPDEQWLIIERPSKSEPPEHYVLCTLPKSLSRKELVRRTKQRWRIERTYEDMKGELGLDHFEGRSYRGWHHHVSTVLACYAFAVAERAQAFPPKTRRTQGNDSLPIAA